MENVPAKKVEIHSLRNIPQLSLLLKSAAFSTKWRLALRTFTFTLDTRPDIVRKNRRASIKQSSIFESSQIQDKKNIALKNSLSKPPPAASSTAASCGNSSTPSKEISKSGVGKSKAELFGIKRVNKTSVESKESMVSMPPTRKADKITDTEIPVTNPAILAAQTVSGQTTRTPDKIGSTGCILKTGSTQSNALPSSLVSYQSSSSGSEVEDGID